jgi:YVTN family beta-propeller protein
MSSLHQAHAKPTPWDRSLQMRPHQVSRGLGHPSRVLPGLALGLLAALVLCALSLSSAAQESAPALKASSGAIAITPDGNTLFVVNPDSNSLTLVDTTSQSVISEVPVGVDPRSVAVAPDGRQAYVANQGSDTLTIVDVRSASAVAHVAVGYRPVGVAVSPDGQVVAVAELGDDQVRLLDAATLSTRAVVAVGDRPCGLAFTPDDSRLLVTHLLSGEVTIIFWRSFSLYLPVIVKGGTMGPLVLAAARQALEPPSLPLISVATWPQVAPAPAVAVNAAGTRAYLPQTMAHGQGLNTQFDTTVFPKVSVLNLETNQHQTAEHIPLPEKDQPVGLPWDVALARGDQELWVVNAASNDVSVLDISNPRAVHRTAHIPVADNPRGIAIHPDGQLAYVNNALAGTISVIDTQLYTVTAVITATEIPLPPVLLQGKRLFNSSARPELSQARWISCNTCHIEGEHDGRTWLLQYTGEVPPGATAVITRNTTSLLGMIETYPLRWSAEWDESADSEFSIRFEQFGSGLIQGEMNATLGPPNQGRSWDLDCLASYIDSLVLPSPRASAPMPPAEDASHSSGLLTMAQTGSGEDSVAVKGDPDQGRELFLSSRTGCSVCHPAPLYTDQRQHDVGTASSYGEWFGPRIDTPTLRFLHDSAPYLHDGSAATLLDVLTTKNPEDKHGVTSDLMPQELDDLVAYLLSLPSSQEEPFTYQASTCLGQPTFGPEQINIWVEGHDIVMAHHGAIYNCCAQMVIYLEEHAPLFKLIEMEEYPDSGACFCLCPYQLGARIANLAPGTYRVQVWNGVEQKLLLEQAADVR